tara:strand:- start:206 stop:394 length:189 start_codon:yes stop_codon:yes gene_type:complete
MNENRGLYDNIHAKQARIKRQKVAKKKNPKVKVERMASVGSKGAPTSADFAKAAKTRTKAIG